MNFRHIAREAAGLGVIFACGLSWLTLQLAPAAGAQAFQTALQQAVYPFVLVDVVDDEPEARWLSVCFYADMVNDPDELGDFVPSGLMGKDACCLNLEEDDPAMRDYILARLGEAAASAAK